jgi:membrane-bound metal-dependent hydrolase YbcI (DUF457 family)
VGHRALTHSLLGLALATVAVLPLAWVDGHWPLAFALGYLSHLLVDAANPQGYRKGAGPSPRASGG